MSVLYHNAVRIGQRHQTGVYRGKSDKRDPLTLYRGKSVATAASGSRLKRYHGRSSLSNFCNHRSSSSTAAFVEQSLVGRIHQQLGALPSSHSRARSLTVTVKLKSMRTTPACSWWPARPWTAPKLRLLVALIHAYWWFWGQFSYGPSSRRVRHRRLSRTRKIRLRVLMKHED